ncbi:MAG: M20/M25/M40 family metallo-hydrolase [Caldisericia bacterium]|nr:M20/M25/M40 family metallo-hydrolase [Caldisericia bacterium]
MDNAIKNFIELCKIPSPSGHEEKVREKILTLYKDLGEWKIDDLGNMYLKVGKGNKALLLNAHIDTVPIDGDSINVIIENGIIKTDGKTILGADDKSGVIAILEGVKRKKDKLNGVVDIVLTVEEETGLKGAKNVNLSYIDAKEGFVFDMHNPPGEIVSESPYHNTFKFFIYGKASHAGAEPEKGINAILLASRAIGRIKLGKIDEETTANIGIIKGGNATNVVPDFVEVHGEARSRDENKLLKLTDEIIKIFIEETEKGGGGKLDYYLNREYNGYKFSEDDKLIVLIKRVFDSLNIKPIVRPTMGGSDSNIFHEKGIKTIVLSCGMMNVHTKEEYIRIEDLMKSIDVVERIIDFYFEN